MKPVSCVYFLSKCNASGKNFLHFEAFVNYSERSSKLTCALDMNSGSLSALAHLRMFNSPLYTDTKPTQWA